MTPSIVGDAQRSTCRRSCVGARWALATRGLNGDDPRRSGTHVSACVARARGFRAISCDRPGGHGLDLRNGSIPDGVRLTQTSGYRRKGQEPVVTTLTRWKLSCALFAAVAVVATVRVHRGPAHNAPARLGAATASRGAMPLALRRS